uniref:Uncharacterized protein n=1 Tax=Panagrolaimus sp. PS1159 TaxID=55785 RepID=A0AC35FYC0_9BILA
MKSGCLFSICAFLLIIQQVSATCSTGVLGKNKTCPAYCAWYTCGLPENFKLGCPEDFERDCKAQTESIKFVNSRNSYDLEYVNIKENVQYFSGCSDAGANGNSCMMEKSVGFSNRTRNVTSDLCLEGGGPCTAKPAGSETTTPVSGSTEQNGALKLIGILAFGWMLLSAALIH